MARRQATKMKAEAEEEAALEAAELQRARTEGRLTVDQALERQLLKDPAGATWVGREVGEGMVEEAPRVDPGSF
eukprot:COSAG05_NODE_8145_length_732_cov_0.639810_2_plen_73_part_01